MYGGMASGSGASQWMSRRPGRSVRTVSQASGTPRAAARPADSRLGDQEGAEELLDFRLQIRQLELSGPGPLELSEALDPLVLPRHGGPRDEGDFELSLHQQAVPSWAEQVVDQGASRLRRLCPVEDRGRGGEHPRADP